MGIKQISVLKAKLSRGGFEPPTQGVVSMLFILPVACDKLSMITLFFCLKLKQTTPRPYPRL